MPDGTRRDRVLRECRRQSAIVYQHSGALQSFLEETSALHDYFPFKVPLSITTAENGTTQAFGSGSLKFATYPDGKETKGELHNGYYIHDIRYRRISVEKLYSQG